MDISLSGILSYIEKEAPILIKKGEYTAEDLCYRFVSWITHQCYINQWFSRSFEKGGGVHSNGQTKYLLSNNLFKTLWLNVSESDTNIKFSKFLLFLFNCSRWKGWKHNAGLFDREMRYIALSICIYEKILGENLHETQNLC